MDKERASQHKLISIVVPIYNVEKYLPKCIESILNQTYKNFELILVDDGAKDNCGKICDEYAQKDNRIIVIHKKNGGLSSARNAGIDIAKGEYIGFVDSDDWIQSEMYEKLVYLIENYNADIAQCEFINAPYEDIKIQPEEEVIKTFTNIEGLNNLYNDMYVSTVVAWNKLYKTTLFKEIRYPNGKIHEDEGTTYKLIFNAKKIVYTNQKYYYYRQTPNSITNAAFNKKRLNILDVFDEKIKYMSKINNDDLYAKTLKWYFFKVINLYFECHKNLKDDKETLDMIDRRAKEAYSMYLGAKGKETKWVALFTIFKINPNLYNFIINKVNG